MKVFRPSLRGLPILKLAGSYLLVIMSMSVIFSAVFYITSVHEIDKRPPHDISSSYMTDPDHELDEWFGRRSSTARSDLALRLIVLNIGAFLLGSGVSYLLARRSLRPVKEALRSQDNFIAEASHELRTPITTALLTNEVSNKNTHLTLKEAREIIQQNIIDLKDLKKLTDELLDLQSPLYHLNAIQLIHVTDLIDAIIKSLTPLSREKNITILNETLPESLYSFSTPLEKIVTIFIDNAIKYSPSNSIIHISSHYTYSFFFISIKDEGSGIKKSEIPHIFERFYRGHTTEPGHGLGLSIAARLARSIQATISVKSTEGKGSEFTLRLPKKRAS